MFTGLIEEIGVVKAVERTAGGARLQVACTFAGELSHGDSVAVDGACMTAVALENGLFAADVSTESLARTTLGELRAGSKVNLERSLAVGQRLGGHFVLGHVDAVGRIAKVSGLGDARRYDIEFPSDLAGLLVEKGSITVDGISLTVNEISERSFWVAIIPETQHATTLGVRKAGDRVNLEGDVLGKYVLRALATGGRVGGVNEALLSKAGYL